MTPITAAIVIAAVLIAAIFVMVVSVAETADAAELVKVNAKANVCVSVLFGSIEHCEVVNEEVSAP